MQGNFNLYAFLLSADFFKKNLFQSSFFKKYQYFNFVLFLFVWFDFLCPNEQFFSYVAMMSGWVFLG